jgi:Copine/C2 domain
MTTRLQLHLSAKNLKNLKGFMGTSDPFAVVTVRGDNENNSPHIVGQTEVYVLLHSFRALVPLRSPTQVATHLLPCLLDLACRRYRVFKNLNPSWSRTIFLEGYKFGVNFFIEVGVFDFHIASTGKSPQELSRMDLHSQAIITKNAGTRELMRNGTFPHKVMGTALFEVGQILGSRGNVASKSLQTGGNIIAHIERCDGISSGQINFQLQGFRLQNVQTLARTSSPYYELYRKVERPTGATWISVYRSNVVRRDLNPLWTEVTLDIQATCNGDIDRAMKVIVWDHRQSGKHKPMGEFETTMRGFMAVKGEDDGFTLKKLEDDVGSIQVIDATLVGVPQEQQEAASPSSAPGAAEGARPQKQRQKRPEFVDYLSGGCQISLAVAIDFTASNGDPREPDTPHYFHPPASKEWNDYEKAIFAVGSILAKYDSDQKFPVWGFGAKYNGVVRHCFQCGTEVEVEGVQGIMDAYRGVFRTPLTMSYPTKFTEVIQTAAAYARHEQVRTLSAKVT